MNEDAPGEFAKLHGFDPFDMGDPFPFYIDARREAPVFFCPDIGYWVVTRHEDVKAVFKDLATFSSEITGKPMRELAPRVKRVLDEGGLVSYSGLSMRMPPDHTRIRGFVSKALTPARTAALEEPVRARVRRMIDELLSAPARASQPRRADIVRELTHDLPALVVFLLLGVPDEDVPSVKQWASSRVALTWGHEPEERQIELAHDMAKYWRYCLDLVDKRFAEKRDDLPSDLVRIYETGDQSITRLEMASVCYTMLFAGHETTSHLLAEGLKTLLIQRERWEMLCADPALIPGAVNELLRYCPPIFAWRRLVKSPTTLGGVHLPAGAHLLLAIGSANRDERCFARAEEVDLRRANADEHLSLGYGVKYCLGGPLARLEARVVLEELTARLPSLRLAPDQTFEYASNTTMRGPRRVLVEWDE